MRGLALKAADRFENIQQLQQALATWDYGQNIKSTASDEEWGKRILCRDESCIGTIGSDGLCRECSKPYKTPLNATTDTAYEIIEKPKPVNDHIINIESTVSDEEWEKRVLCRDESCIGTIGLDGRCRECGILGKQ